MAHIANNIEVNKRNLSQVFSDKRYRIDTFQREYRWQRKQIEALISDLSISFKKNHKPTHTVRDCSGYDSYYMGPIVLCESNNELSIVDGQQRLTSLTLLLIYLHHQQNTLEQTKIKLIDLKKYLYVSLYGEETFVLNVKSREKLLNLLIQKPDAIFSKVEDLESNLQLDTDEDIKDLKLDESIQNLIARYEDITKLFPEELNTADVLPLFVQWLLEKLIIVEVRAFSIENAYTIFETMNDRGLSLNPTEILKAYLLHSINDDNKSDEVNDFWKERIAFIKSVIGNDADLDFFRAWLRAKYAESTRSSRAGAENEDFELIGTQFHSWVKNNPSKTFLKQSDDYYFFIRSDFDFFSNLYIRIFELKTKEFEGFEDIYCSNFYPIADSLSYPLLISPVSKIDDSNVIDDKIKLTAKFIDIFTLTRVIIGKAITQSTIRYYMYELVKAVRNLETEQLKVRLNSELEKLDIKPYSYPLRILHRMDNWGFYHYLFARLLYKQNPEYDFSSLLRSKKQSSLVLYKFFDIDDKPNEIEDITWQLHFNSVAGHCLVRRYDLENIMNKKGIKLLNYLVKQGYMPEMIGFKTDDVVDFISTRDHRLRELIDDILKF